MQKSIFFEILNRRLPLEDGSDRRETLGKRVSDDLQFFIFRRWKNKMVNFLQKKSGSLFFQKGKVLEELWFFDPSWQVGRKKLLPELPLFLGWLPWKGGKRLNMCWNPRLGTKNDFNHLVLWSGGNTIIWYYDGNRSVAYYARHLAPGRSRRLLCTHESAGTHFWSVRRLFRILE